METTVKTLSHLTQTATSAFSGISFDPEKRGASIVNDYSAELDEDIESIRALGANEEQISRYKSNYETKLRGWLYSQSNIVSTMIAGPSNFPSERMRKRNQWADNHYSNFREWRTKVLNAYKKYHAKKAIEAAGGEIGITRRYLTRLTTLRDNYTNINNAYKLHRAGQSIESLGLNDIEKGWATEYVPMRSSILAKNTHSNQKN